MHARVQAWWLNAAIERAAHFADALALLLLPQQNSATGTRTRVARVRAEYPNQLDYSGSAVHVLPLLPIVARLVRSCIAIRISVALRC